MAICEMAITELKRPTNVMMPFMGLHAARTAKQAVVITQEIVITHKERDWKDRLPKAPLALERCSRFS